MTTGELHPSRGYNIYHSTMHQNHKLNQNSNFQKIKNDLDLIRGTNKIVAHST